MIEEISNSLVHLEKGNIFLYPTDTVWGIGCDASNEAAVSKIYQLKNRAETKSLIVLVSSIEMLKKHVSITENILNFINSTLNPTTIIYNNPKGFAKNTIASDNTIAIRIVQNEFCKKLIDQFGKPIVSTSANVSGEPTPKSFAEITQPILEGVDYIVNLHRNEIATKSSTIVKINNDVIEILRA